MNFFDENLLTESFDSRSAILSSDVLDKGSNLTTDCLNSLREENKLYYESNKVLYKSLLENKSVEESFETFFGSQYDRMKLNKKMFERLMKECDKRLSVHSELFEKSVVNILKNINNISFPIVTSTNVVTNISDLIKYPNTEAVNNHCLLKSNISNLFNNEITSLDKYNDHNVAMSEDLNKIRAELLGYASDTPISEAEFKDACVSRFNPPNNEIELTIENPNDLRDLISGYREIIKEFKMMIYKDTKQMKSIYDGILNDIKEAEYLNTNRDGLRFVGNFNIKKVFLPKSFVGNVDTNSIIKFEAEKVRYVMDAFVLAYSIKMDSVLHDIDNMIKVLSVNESNRFRFIGGEF